MTVVQQHRNWRADVERVVRDLEASFPGLECITYIDHPWPGWDGRSFDVWADARSWSPASLERLKAVRHYLMTLSYGPRIRHTILAHQLWTSFGGRSRWEPDDHSGTRRHLHVTYW
jgi:hypothetical protein